MPGTWAADAHDARPLRLTSQLMLVMLVMLGWTCQELGRLMLMMLPAGLDEPADARDARDAG